MPILPSQSDGQFESYGHIANRSGHLDVDRSGKAEVKVGSQCRAVWVESWRSAKLVSESQARILLQICRGEGDDARIKRHPGSDV